MKSITEADLTNKSGEFFDSGQEELFFDDGPVDRACGASGHSRPHGTPASAIRLWTEGYHRAEGCVRALVKIFTRNHGLAQPFYDDQDLELAIARLLQAEESSNQQSPGMEMACHFCLMALALAGEQKAKAVLQVERTLKLLKNPKNRCEPESQRITLAMVELLDQSGLTSEAACIQKWQRRQVLIQGEAKVASLKLRELALELVLEGEYETAERIYYRLIALKFETTSNYCHLARIHLLTGRDAEVAVDVETAWLNREGVEPYILSRILFFQILLAMLAKRRFQSKLNDLKNLVLEQAPHYHWHFSAMLDKLKPRLSAPAFNFMMQLGQALSHKQGMGTLANTPLWQKSHCPSK